MLAAALSLVSLSSCEKMKGEGPVTTEVRVVEDFNAISSGISGQVYFRQGENYNVEVQAQRNILEILQTRVVGTELVIKFKDNVRVRTHEPITVIVTAPILEGANVSGSGNMEIQGVLQTDNLSLRVSGSGNINAGAMHIHDQLTAVISGSGNIIAGAAGIVKRENLRISGSGRMELQMLEGLSAIAEISGSGNMKVRLSQSLDARVSGSGSILYAGTPQVSTSISGSGTVRPL